MLLMYHNTVVPYDTLMLYDILLPYDAAPPSVLWTPEASA